MDVSGRNVNLIFSFSLNVFDWFGLIVVIRCDVVVAFVVVVFVKI